MPTEERVHDLGYDRALVAENAGEEGIAASQARDDVVPQLIPHAPAAIAGLDQGPEGPDAGLLTIHDGLASLGDGGSGLDADR